MAREVLYQGLLEIPVLYQDNTKDSLDYFRISQLPTEFTAGKNLFSFKCNPDTFLDNSPLYVEVLDSAGYPIYTEVDINAENDDQFAVVSVFVDESTAPGPGTIILCGIIDRDTSGNEVNTNNGINIRWNNPIQIYPSKRNTSEIVYSTLPSISISSSLRPYVNYFYPVIEEPKIYVYRDIIGGLDEQFHRVYSVNDHLGLHLVVERYSSDGRILEALNFNVDSLDIQDHMVVNRAQKKTQANVYKTQYFPWKKGEKAWFATNFCFRKTLPLKSLIRNSLPDRSGCCSVI